MKRSNFGEADRLITFYTKHYGKVVCLAKGVRRLTSRKRGNLEIFNLVSFIASKGKGMDIVTEVETLNAFSGWRKDLKKVASAYMMCEMVDKLTAEGSEQQEVYELLVSYLKKLGSIEEKDLSFLLNNFGELLVKILGFWPKDKIFLPSFNVSLFIEQIMEKELKSKRFLKRI